jgi:hypothetical protein
MVGSAVRDSELMEMGRAKRVVSERKELNVVCRS